MLRVHVRRGLEGTPGDRLCEPFSWLYVSWALLAGLVLVASVGFASSVVLSGGVVLLWFVPPVATLIFCIQPRAAWPYTAAALATVEVVAVVSGHGRISQDSLAAFLLIFPDLLSTALGTLVLRPLIGGSIGIVRSSTFIRYLGLYVLIITPSFSLVSVAIIVLLPSNNINWCVRACMCIAPTPGHHHPTRTLILTRHHPQARGAAAGGGVGAGRLLRQLLHRLRRPRLPPRHRASKRC